MTGRVHSLLAAAARARPVLFAVALAALLAAPGVAHAAVPLVAAGIAVLVQP